MPSKPLLIGLALLAIGLGVWFLWPKGGPEEQIRRQLDALQEVMLVEGKTPPLQAVAKARQVTSFFAPTCLIEAIPGSKVMEGRDALQGPATSYFTGVTRGSVLFRLVSLTVGSRGETAQSVLEVTIRAEFPAGEERGRERMIVEWIRHEGRWVMLTVRPEEI